MLCNTPVCCNMHPVHKLNAIRCATIHVVFGICMLKERVYQQKIHGRAIGSSVSEVIVNLVREDSECRASFYCASQGYSDRSVSVFSFTSPCIPQTSSCEDTDVHRRGHLFMCTRRKLVSQALLKNGYPKGFIHKYGCLQPDQQTPCDHDTHGISDSPLHLWIVQIHPLGLTPPAIHVTFHPFTTLLQELVHSKDPVPANHKKG